MTRASRTLDLIQLDRQHLWHPFTQMHAWVDSEPLVIESGQGSWLTDTDERKYLDGVSSLWVNVHGHNHPDLNRALHAQLEKVAHTTLLGLSNPPAIDLAARLIELAPAGLSRVFYSDSGSTAVEIALKMAFQYWQLVGRPEKRRFLHLANAYHGDTLGAVAVGGIPLFHQIFGPIIIETLSVPAPHTYRHPAGPDPANVCTDALASLRDQLHRQGDQIAAFILEPLVQGAAGMLVQPPGYLQAVAALCREHEVLLIADEVATGFGRTGTLFACEQEAVAPDLLCLAKGITGGYLPLAATLASDAIYRAFLDRGPAPSTFFHGHTYTGNPLACSVALASLELFARDRVLERVGQRRDQLAVLLADQLGDSPWVGDVRQRGLMVGIELVSDRETTAPFHADRRTGVQVCLEARSRGVLLRPLGDVIVLMPPLSIEPAELELLVTTVARSIEAVLG